MRLVGATLLALASLAAPARSQDHPVPPPPPPTHHSQPGPFVAAVDGQGAMIDVGVIANAVGSWAGNRERAFILCFGPGGPKVDWPLALRSLDNVARELGARGATIVVVRAARLCAGTPPDPVPRRPFVAITGALQTRD